MKTISFKQVVTIEASPEKVYHALMNSKLHSEIIGSAAIISTKVGGKFSVFDGYSFGKNLELKANKRIVQAWHAREDKWPADHFSEVTFDLELTENGGCKITLTHKNVPAEIANNFKQGWKDFYWKPMKTFFKNSR